MPADPAIITSIGDRVWRIHHNIRIRASLKLTSGRLSAAGVNAHLTQRLNDPYESLESSPSRSRFQIPAGAGLYAREKANYQKM